MMMITTTMKTTPRRSPHKGPRRSGFTLTELLIAVVVLVAIILAVSKIFSTTSDLVGLGEATADVLQEKNAIDRQLRNDLERMTHEGVFAIRCIGVRNDAYLTQQGRLLNPALPPNAEIRSDQLVFFANGAESTRTFQPGEGLNQKGQSAVSRIYFGHAFQLGEQGAAADYNGGDARAYDPVPGGEPIYPWSFQVNAVRTSYDFAGSANTFNTTDAGSVRLPPIDARGWLLARQAVILADDGSDASGGNDPTEYLDQTTTAYSIFLLDEDLGETVFPIMQGRVDGAVTQMNDVRRQILFDSSGNARTWFEQQDRILGETPFTLGGLVYHPRGERIAPGMGRVDQALTAHVMGTACSSVKIEWTYDRGVGQIVDRNGFITSDVNGNPLTGFDYDGTEPRPWFGLPDYGADGNPDPGEDVILFADLENFAIQYDVPAIFPRNVERTFNYPAAGLRFYEAVFGYNQGQAIDRTVGRPTENMGFTPWPSALRITLTLHDGDTKLEAGETIQFIVNLPDRAEPAIF